jgi:hypothetical protein
MNDTSLNKDLLPRSARRLRYEAEVQVIIKEIGSLEQVRGRLGLSQRRMCELLLVDPSAWTRWVQRKQIAPPHVFRMLEWYLLIKKEHGGLAHQFYERRAPSVTTELGESRLRADFRNQITQLERELRRWKLLTFRASLVIFIFMAGLVGYLVLSAFKMSPH